MHHPASLLLPAALLCAAVCAHPVQADFDLDKTTPATLGDRLGLAYAGASPSKALLVAFSLTPGPFPLALVDARDTRVLEVGVELVDLWVVAGSGTGSGALGFPLPLDAALQGLELHFQTLTLPGPVLVVDGVSNMVKARMGAPGATALLAARLVQGRALAAAFPRAAAGAGAGDVVLAGGGSGGLTGGLGLATSEIWDFRRMEVRPGPRMGLARILHTAVALRDGRVLVAGGVDDQGAVLAAAEIYDPAAGAFLPTAPMGTARAGHAAALLPDGKVLVAGGTTNVADPVAALAGTQASAEIYDPATGTWSAARAMSARRLVPAMTALRDGRVLVSGGFQVNVVFGLPIPVGSVATCEYFTPASGTWSAAPTMRSSRAAHQSGALLLADGRVLVAGGAASGPDLTQAAAMSRAEVLDPGAGSWTALPDMDAPRTGHAAALAGDGRVVVAGGGSGPLFDPVPLSSVQELDPTAGTWRALSPLRVARGGHAAFFTPDGLLVLAGGAGAGAGGTLDTIEVLHR